MPSFDEADRNHDGVLDRGEFNDAMRGAPAHQRSPSEAPPGSAVEEAEQLMARAAALRAQVVPAQTAMPTQVDECMDRQTDKQTDRQTDRLTDRQTDRHTD